MDIYKGYQLLRGNTEEINAAMENIDFSNWNTNEYLLIQNTDDGSEREMRFNGFDFVPLKLPPSKYIKAKNALQRCALDALVNPEITVVAILGLPGSGKSYLATRCGIYAIHEKGFHQGIVSVREPISSGKESGYLPGEYLTKIAPYYKPIEEQLNGGEFEFQSLQQRGEFEAITPHYIKGRTLTDKYIMVEEAEDLTERQIRLIGTRVAERSKIVFSGDYKQSEIDRSCNNPLVKMTQFFKGHPRFACVYLEEDVRSETSKMFADMYFD